MAVTVLDSGVGTDNDTSGANFSVSAGSNRKLIHCTCINGAGDTMDSLTYGTQSMSLVLDSGEANSRRMYIWELDDAGIDAASSTVFVASYTGSPASTRMSHFVISIQDTVQTAGAWATAINLVDADPIEAAIAAMGGAFGIASARFSNATNTWSWANGWTEQHESSGLVDNSDTYSTKSLTPASETLSANPTGSGGEFSILHGAVFAPDEGNVYINDAATWDSGAVDQTYPGNANWSDTSIDMQTVPDTTGLSGQLYVIVETATGAVASRAITVGDSGITIAVPTGPLR